jgi:hypothetical protein
MGHGRIVRRSHSAIQGADVECHQVREHAGVVPLVAFFSVSINSVGLRKRSQLLCLFARNVHMRFAPRPCFSTRRTLVATCGQPARLHLLFESPGNVRPTVTLPARISTKSVSSAEVGPG